jgi:adenylyltransferase/sulfurtransferase
LEQAAKNPVTASRYFRQIIYEKIGSEGQKKISAAKVTDIGIGALGTVIANNLCRSGVGCLRLVDRDYVELSNLQRQVLFNEDDAAAEVPKAAAACAHLAKINSETKLEPVIVHVDSSNIEDIIKNADVVMDGCDNMELRFLINEACHKLKIPWVYGGVLGAAGNSMTILPGDGPCFRCLVPEVPPAGSYPTCANTGVLNMASNIIASIESAQAIKIITGFADLNRQVFALDVWNNTAEYLNLSKDPDCPVCAGGEYEILNRRAGTLAASLCGRDEYQIIPGQKTFIDLTEFESKLSNLGTVKRSRFMLGFSGSDMSFNLFPDGRAIIKNVKDEKAARSVYSEYIGL